LKRIHRTHRLTRSSSGLFFTAAALLLVGTVSLFTGCRDQRTGDSGSDDGSPIRSDRIVIEVTVRPELMERWKELRSAYPLPDEVVLISAGGSKLVENSGDPSGPPHTAVARLEILQPVNGTLPDPSAGSRVIELDRIPVIPAVPLWDPRIDVDRETAVALPRLSGIDRSSPPEGAPRMKGVSVEGMYPSHPGYPLAERTVLTFRWSDSEGPAAGSGTSSQASTADGPEESNSPTGMIEAWLNAVEAAHLPGPEDATGTVRWIAGVGDLMVQRGIQDILISQGPSGLERIFTDTLPVLQSQDFLMGNLEGAVTRRGTPTPKSYNFRFSPAVLPPLKSAGFDYFSITNNHCYDYGSIGFTDTLDHLVEHGIATSGAGRTPSEAYAPYETDISGYPLKIFSVGAYPREKNGFDGRSQAAVTETRAGIVFSGPQALEAIRSFAGPDSIDVIMAHGGEEWTYTPTADQQAFYRSCIDAGADLVIGHHPHVLQGMEYYGEGLIAYSTGNFLFPGMYVMPHAEESVILSVGFIGDRPVYVHPYPVRIDNRVISLEDPPGEILKRLLRLTEDLQD